MTIFTRRRKEPEMQTPDTASEIADLRERLAALEAEQHPPELTPEQQEARRLTAIQEATAKMFGPVRTVDPLAGIRSSAPTIERPWPTPVREDRGWGTVLCGDMQAFVVPPDRRAGHR